MSELGPYCSVAIVIFFVVMFIRESTRREEKNLPPEDDDQGVGAGLRKDTQMEESEMSEKLFDWLLRIENLLQVAKEPSFKVLSEIRQEMRTALFKIDDENAGYYRLASGG